MGFITGLLVVSGVVAVGGGIYYAATEDDRAREKIKQLEAENKQLETAKNYVNGIKSKLTSAKEYLNEGKNDFKKGGHVLDDVPLANPEFTSCISKLDSAIKSANSLINDFNSTIAQNNKDIRTEQAKLN